MHDEIIDGTNEGVRGNKAHIHWSDAMARLASVSNESSLMLFEHGTLQLKIYAPRGHDPQTPHTRDEIYVVAQGSGIFFDGASRRPFQVGDLLFAPAGSTHRFEDFTDDFAVWVMFYGPEGGEL